MNQTAIQSLKKRYKKELLRRVVLLNADRDDLASQLRNINLKDCCYMIVQARNSISGSTLRVSWNELLGYNENCVKQSLDCDDELHNSVEEDENEVPSHSEAYSCLKVGLKWMEQQKEFSATQLMLMRHICDVAARKLSWFKQKL
ncbi:hypothetical protein T12_15451 [Trichinella patagoniensis]|uniref:Jerky-like protein-like n=1 Tax=Trichinella patagoniensis TaxID=990121 RepID=A0A0V1A7C2_9BILA|nr:hypothetical protein T12_15451 [Trichinella patagoniensis]